jgi:ketosteroid isomerase-like protein
VSEENVALVQGLYDAFGRGDVAHILGKLSADVDWLEAENFPYADQNPYRSPEAIAAGVFARCAGEWEDFAVAMDDLIDGGDRVVALGRYSGTFRQTNQAMNPRAVHVWTIDEGKVVAFRQYIDTLDVARATGAF